MNSKKKICKRCEKEVYIFARGLCKSCDMISNPAKYKIDRVSKEKTKKPKSKTLSQLKKELDIIFSLYIRLIDSDANGNVACFTSGKVYPYNKLQAGHYISRRHLATRWHEWNVKPQSIAENMFNQGNAPQFAVNLDKLYGIGTAANLLEISREDKKFTKDDLQEMITDYTEKVKQLKEQKGL